MDWTTLLKAIGLCLISVLIETASFSKEGKKWFEDLKRPKYCLSLQAWYFVGAVYYILFGIIAYRQFEREASLFSMPIILVALVMVLNGLGNFVVFKYRSLKWFYLMIYPFCLLLWSLMLVLFPVDKLSAALACVYFLWLIYDLYYSYQLWKLNEDLE